MYLCVYMCVCLFVCVCLREGFFVCLFVCYIFNEIIEYIKLPKFGPI